MYAFLRNLNHLFDDFDQIWAHAFHQLLECQRIQQAREWMNAICEWTKLEKLKKCKITFFSLIHLILLTHTSHSSTHVPAVFSGLAKVDDLHVFKFNQNHQINGLSNAKTRTSVNDCIWFTFAKKLNFRFFWFFWKKTMNCWK